MKDMFLITILAMFTLGCPTNQSMVDTGTLEVCGDTGTTPTSTLTSTPTSTTTSTTTGTPTGTTTSTGTEDSG
jgi:hypothetical protein